MAFIKHGDGKIVNVFEEGELTEEQKKSAKKATQQNKTADVSSTEKKSGR